MPVYCLRAIVGAAPWNNGRSDTTTAVVVVAPNEERARQLAAACSGSEGYDAWVMRPSFVRVYDLSAMPPETEEIILDDSQ